MKILITGTSSGLGLALTRYYLRQGHTVWGMSRKHNKELDNSENFRFLQKDISLFQELKEDLPSFLQGVDKLDLVILNAGKLNQLKDLKDTGIEEIKNTMDVNTWSNKVIIDLLFKCVKEIQQVVAISSGASVSGSRGWNAYSLSKATLNMLISLYAKEHENTHFCALAPGLIDTQMQDYIYSLQDGNKYPVVKKLKAAKGTSKMPKPDEAAIIVAKAIEKLNDFESGSFQDVRKI